MARDLTFEGHFHSEGHYAPESHSRHPARHGHVPHDPLPPAHLLTETAVRDNRHDWDAMLEGAPIEGLPIVGELGEGELGEGELGAGLEWGSEGALAQLLSAALGDVAPGAVRERVMSAVDAVLREPVAVPAFPADAAPVTTLSGVFEKRRPTTQAASCIELPPPAPVVRPASIDDAVENGVGENGVGGREGTPAEPHEGSFSDESASADEAMQPPAVLDGAAPDPASVGVAPVYGGLPRRLQRPLAGSDEWSEDWADAVRLELTNVARPLPASSGAMQHARAPAEVASTEGMSAGLVTAAGGGHCSGGPMVGGRCWLVSAAEVVGASPILASPAAIPERVIPGTAAPRAAAPSAGVARAGVPTTWRAPATAVGPAPARSRFQAGAFAPARAAFVSDLHIPRPDILRLDLSRHVEAGGDASERSVSARLRDGVATSALNLAQLAAAIVVGIVIGKAAHLIMAEESAMAWSPSDEATAGLRAEPDTFDAVSAADAVEAADPMAAARAFEGEPQRGEPQGRDADGLDSHELESQDVEMWEGRARRAPRSRAASSVRASSRASGSGRSAAAANARRAVPCSLASAQALAATALPPAPLPVAVAPFGCPTPVATAVSASTSNIPSGAPAWLAAPSRRVIQRANAATPASSNLLTDHRLTDHRLTGHRLTDNAQPPFAPAPDDWLGEQLAILGRAERSLSDGDPESAIRSLDEYQSRFPDGLLDPQMGSIRQRLEERFTAFIFP